MDLLHFRSDQYLGNIQPNHYFWIVGIEGMVLTSTGKVQTGAYG